MRGTGVIENWILKGCPLKIWRYMPESSTMELEVRAIPKKSSPDSFQRMQQVSRSDQEYVAVFGRS